MNLLRITRHLLLPDWWVSRGFPASTRQVIEAAVAASEQTHLGELRFVAEAGLPIASLLSDQSSRARAIDLFARLGVWDTEHNSGVLIYVQLIDRRVEIVADRGINTRVEQTFWDSVCRELEVAFRSNRFEEGVVQAIGRISATLQTCFPVSLNSSQSSDNRNTPNENENELPDKPIFI